ncbi:MAG: phosphoribosylanthranilate isomerase [Actinobacteria bacterium]|nr:phosphoribosylanthranilate isomerase [Actinomycetota bacterium]
MFVKICGITNLEDAFLSIECGADAIGLIFANSPRRVELNTAREIAVNVKGRAELVGVFCDMEPDVVEEISKLCTLDLLQFHGNEDPAYCSMFRERAIKAVRLKSSEDLHKIRFYNVEFIMVDSAKSGETFDWGVLRELELADKRVILAGGLNPDNVTAAIKQVMPFGVDSSSGVEAHVGKKDPLKVREFVVRAKGE